MDIHSLVVLINFVEFASSVLTWLLFFNKKIKAQSSHSVLFLWFLVGN